MILENYIELTAGSYPTVQLNKNSYEVLKDIKKIQRKLNEVVTFDYYENNLFQKLNGLRKKISEKENVAPYIIFSDMTLFEMAEKKPKNRWEMLKIKGVGNQKFKNYGEDEKENVAPYIIFSDMTLFEMAEKKPKNRWEMLKIKGVGNQKFKNYGEDFLNIINEFSEEDLEKLKIENIIDEEYLEISKIENLKRELNEDLEKLKIENIIDEEYLEISKIENLKRELNLNMDTQKLKDIIIKNLFL